LGSTLPKGGNREKREKGSLRKRKGEEKSGGISRRRGPYCVRFPGCGTNPWTKRERIGRGKRLLLEGYCFRGSPKKGFKDKKQTEVFGRGKRFFVLGIPAKRGKGWEKKGSRVNINSNS